MALMARANLAELQAAWTRLDPPPAFEMLRPPETGLLMIRGRMGGTGSPFNLGEATVTRATVRLTELDLVGFATVMGRDRRQAGLAALLDAAWQAPAFRPVVEEGLLEPVRLRLEADARLAARRTEATRVNFFTLARGEDA